MKIGRFHLPGAVALVGLLLMVASFPYDPSAASVPDEGQRSWLLFILSSILFVVGNGWLLAVFVAKAEKTPRSTSKRRKRKKRKKKKR